MKNDSFDPKAGKNERGMTLIEVIVSVALLGFLALGTMSLLGVAISQNNLAKKRTVATGLASGRLNKIQAERYHTEPNYLGYRLAEETAVVAGPSYTLTADYGSIPEYPDYRRVVTLDYGVPYSGMLRVQSSVFWRDLKQGEKEHRMITYLHPGIDTYR